MELVYASMIIIIFLVIKFFVPILWCVLFYRQNTKITVLLTNYMVKRYVLQLFARLDFIPSVPFMRIFYYTKLV